MGPRGRALLVTISQQVALTFLPGVVPKFGRAVHPSSRILVTALLRLILAIVVHPAIVPLTNNGVAGRSQAMASKLILIMDRRRTIQQATLSITRISMPNSRPVLLYSENLTWLFKRSVTLTLPLRQIIPFFLTSPVSFHDYDRRRLLRHIDISHRLLR